MTLRHDFIPRLTISDADDCTTILAALTVYMGTAARKAESCPCGKPICGFMIEMANASELIDLAIHQLNSITETNATFGTDVTYE